MILFRWMLATVRLVLFLLITAFCSTWAVLAGLLGARFGLVYSAVNTWRYLMIRAMGLHIEVEGTPPQIPALILPNHRSYTDVVVLVLRQPLVFVAKIEVSRWPILGWGSTAVHTVWIDRKDRESRRHTREQIERRLSDGESVVVFPEGTTFRGPGALTLRPGMFQVVARTGVPIIPVAIEYENPDMAWVDADTFLPHFMQQFGTWRNRVKVRYGQPMYGDEADQLRLDVQTWLNTNLIAMREDWENG